MCTSCRVNVSCARIACAWSFLYWTAMFNWSKVVVLLTQWVSEKCEFFQKKITYCGDVVDQDGLHKTQEKVEAVVNAPRPENVQQVRSFLGLVNYYHKFQPNLATTLHPLNQLLEQGKRWKWTTECEAALIKVKKLMVLTHYDPVRPLRLACDAPPVGIGPVLSHIMDDGSERPIAFASRTLSKAERNYSQIDKVALALVWGVKKFHPLPVWPSFHTRDRPRTSDLNL